VQRDRESENKDSLPYYEYEYRAESGLFIFRYNLCREEENRPIQPFLQEMLTQIELLQPDKILFDFRKNSGGNSSLLSPFIREFSHHLLALRPNTLFCAMGPQTFSSGTDPIIRLFFAGLLREEIDKKLYEKSLPPIRDESLWFEEIRQSGLTSSTSVSDLFCELGINRPVSFIGETMGGSPSHFGRTQIEKYNSHLWIQFSKTHLDSFLGKVFEPDITCVPALDEYLTGKDIVVEYLEKMHK